MSPATLGVSPLAWDFLFIYVSSIGNSQPVLTRCLKKGLYDVTCKSLTLRILWQYVQKNVWRVFVIYMAETVDIRSNISRWVLQVSAMLHSADWSFVTGFSKQPTSLTFKKSLGLSALKMGLTGCTKMLHNIPEERRSHSRRGGSLTSRDFIF